MLGVAIPDCRLRRIPRIVGSSSEFTGALEAAFFPPDGAQIHPVAGGGAMTETRVSRQEARVENVEADNYLFALCAWSSMSGMQMQMGGKETGLRRICSTRTGEGRTTLSIPLVVPPRAAAAALAAQGRATSTQPVASSTTMLPTCAPHRAPHTA